MFVLVLVYAHYVTMCLQSCLFANMHMCDTMQICTCVTQCVTQCVYAAVRVRHTCAVCAGEHVGDMTTLTQAQTRPKSG